jgi:hypothetical protein
MSSRPSKAAKAFLETHQRILELGNLHLQLRKQDGGPHKCCDDILRASVVLGVAAMDAFFTRRFCELLVPFLKKNGPNERLIALLSKAGLGAQAALEMAVMDRPFRRIRSLVETYLSDYTAQRFAAIDELFLTLGLRDISKHSAGKAGRATLLRSVEKLVERRHCIVHEGDLNRHGRLTAIDGRTILKRLRDTTLFVQHADALITTAVKV